MPYWCTNCTPQKGKKKMPTGKDPRHRIPLGNRMFTPPIQLCSVCVRVAPVVSSVKTPVLFAYASPPVGTKSSAVFQ